ncbi:MAG: DUF3419 family protein [Caldilineaceae bacterium]
MGRCRCAAGRARYPAGERCLSIASAGDNTLALLARDPAQVIALDLNPAQLFCLELRVAAYRTLTHQQLLELMGARPCTDRAAHYARCRPLLSTDALRFWDKRCNEVECYGLGGVGKFERYFRIFRRWVLPLVHDRQTVQQVLVAKPAVARQAFFENKWNSRRWRFLVQTFFSQRVMGWLGRDPSFFAYVDGNFASHVTAQIRRALCDLDPATNPYLHWILTGTHGEQLPFALRAENFDHIRANLDRLEWHLMPIEAYAVQARSAGIRIDKFNLSNIFEYMSGARYQHLLQELAAMGRPGSRLLYWNMMVPRSCPAALQTRLRPLRTVADQLFAVDQAMFYSALQIDEVVW